MWRCGKRNPADYLSRHGQRLSGLPREIQEETEEFSKICWFIHGSPFIETITVEAIREHTDKCPLLSELREQIRRGHRPDKEGELEGFRKIFDELTVSDGGLVMRGERIVLPV